MIPKLIIPKKGRLVEVLLRMQVHHILADFIKCLFPSVNISFIVLWLIIDYLYSPIVLGGKDLSYSSIMLARPFDRATLFLKSCKSKGSPGVKPSAPRIIGTVIGNVPVIP